MTSYKRQGYPRIKESTIENRAEKDKMPDIGEDDTAGQGPRIYNSDSWMMLDESSASADENWSLGIVLL